VLLGCVENISVIVTTQRVIGLFRVCKFYCGAKKSSGLCRDVRFIVGTHTVSGLCRDCKAYCEETKCYWVV
jgi:hypothetical protein